MKNEDNTNSRRYYIFSHQPGSEEDTVLYRGATGDWHKDFDKANLWADHAFVTKKAKQLKRDLDSQPALGKFNVVIGQVKIEVNGMFPLELV